MQQPLCFLDTDVGAPPPPGWYAGTIATACWRSSSRNNRMVYLVVALDGVGSPYDRICDYFVLEGVTPRGIACSRRRLVTVFRAGGLIPCAGEEIRPGCLEGLRIEVKLAHEPWKGKVRLEIKEYRSLSAPREPEVDENQDDTLAPSAVMPHDSFDGRGE